MDKTCTSLDQQYIVQDELLQENFTSASYAERNVPKELTLNLGIVGLENVWRHGGERKAY